MSTMEDVIEQMLVEHILAWLARCGTEEDLSGLFSHQRPSYFRELMQIKNAAEIAVERAVLTLEKWAKEADEERKMLLAEIEKLRKVSS